MMEHQGHQRAESSHVPWRTNSKKNTPPGGLKRHSSYSNDKSAELPSSFCGRGSGNYEKMTRHDYEDMENKIWNYFNKKFHFLPPLKNWTLPEPSNMFIADKWQEHRLQVLKEELNRVKSKLDLYDLNDWHKHTRLMNKAGEIQWRLRKEIEPEFLTQAWCKFYENAMSFPLVPPVVVNKEELNSVHLCEAPGAFITSLNHYLKLHHPNIKWNWQATTLNPYYEGNPLSCMINDDRFILQTLSHWKFGLDYTGNLMVLKNMLCLVKDAEEMGEVLLVTADGSIDCQEDPGAQESIVSSLHYCETVAALHILAPGGTFLIKMFTMYEYETICLMYLLCCAFNGVRVCKPATSKEGNSEVYVVCLEYKGKQIMEPWLSVLRKHFGHALPVKPMFPYSSIPQYFLDQLYECATTFKNYQTEVIETNIRVYEGLKIRGEHNIIKKMRYLISNHFMETYEMKKLDNSDSEVVGKEKLKKTMTLNMDPRADEGSFDDRRKKAMLKPLDLLRALKEEVINVNVDWPHKEDIGIMHFPECVDGFEIKIGQPVKTVQSSKFCLGKLLKIRNKVHKVAREHFYKSSSNTSGASSIDSPTFQKENKNDENLAHESELSDRLREWLRKKNRKTDLIILNYKEKLWTSMEGGNEEAELNAFLDVKEVIDDIWREENLLLQGYPMLTQFNVGIVYMLCHLFEEVGFVKPHKQDFGILFYGFRKWNPKMKKFLQQVEETMEKLQDEGREQAVLSLFPINQLCERFTNSDVEFHGTTSKSENETEDYEIDIREEVNDNLFYKSVTEVNHLCVKEQILDIIGNIHE